MVHLTSHLPAWQLAQQRVFVRADLNVPFDAQGNIAQNHRLQEFLPTLSYICEHGGYPIVATHIGRPTAYDSALSTQHLIPWFTQQGYDVIFEKDLAQAVIKSHTLHNKQILLLENLRFFAGEKSQDATFAQQLYTLADYYVNDAFGTLHRQDTSITLLPKLFATNKRTIGFLVERELFTLNKLLTQPRKPFVLALGGGKVHDKIPLVQNLLDKIDTLLLCPAIVFSFLAAQNKQVGRSLVNEQAFQLCKTILQEAQTRNISVVMPIDYQIALDTFTGPLNYTDAQYFPENAVGVSIGPKTATLFDRYIQQAGTVFYNGTMGSLTRPETLEGMHAILTSMTRSSAFTVVGGGDSVGVAYHYGLGNKISHLSTGGGATLAYLSGEQLPGLEVFIP